MKKGFKRVFCAALGGAMLLTGGSVPASAEHMLVGDVNQDGYIGMDDARLILCQSLALDLSTYQGTYADFGVVPGIELNGESFDLNGDGTVNFEDVTASLDAVINGYATNVPVKKMETIPQPTLKCTKKGNDFYECSVYVNGDLTNFDYGLKYDADKISKVTVDFTQSFSEFYDKESGVRRQQLDQEKGYIAIGGITVLPSNYNGKICTITFRATDDQAQIGLIRNSASADFNDFQAESTVKLSEAFIQQAGDVNADGKVDLDDARVILIKALGINDTQINAVDDETLYDLDGNGVINLADANYSLNIALGIAD